MSELRLTQTVVVANPNGLHARPATMIVKLAKQFQSQVTLIRGNERADGKSIWDLLALGVEMGTPLRVEVCGPDADKAMPLLVEIIQRNFEKDLENAE